MTWLTIVAMAVITFTNRYLFLSEAIRFQPGPRTRLFLTYSSYAIMTSIWTPIVFGYSPASGLSYSGNDYVIGAIAALLLTWLQFRTIVVVLLSTSVFFAMRFLL